MSEPLNVLVLLPLSEEQRARLESGAPFASFTYASYEDATPEQVGAAEVIVGNLAPTCSGVASS